MSGKASAEFPLGKVAARAYRIPTDRPESDGTLEWDGTTLVVVHAEAGGRRGMGYSYGPAAAAGIVAGQLAGRVGGLDAMDVPRAWAVMLEAIRNDGEDGPAMMAVSALDAALWDLKARLLDVPLARLLGRVRESVPVYGSGGFTSYTERELREQLGGWASEGIPRVKMKIGRDPEADPDRVRAARRAIGPRVELFVDANGAYDRKQALAMAEELAELGVSWYEEPVWHRDLEGLRLLRDRAPAGMEVAAGEYGFNLPYFRHMLEAGAVDVLQADATRCGISGFLEAGTLCCARGLPFSSHCAPSLHLHPACAVRELRHVEYFHDHVRIERMLFDGAAGPVGGALRPDMARPGLGLELKSADARRYEV